ncbi:hypothetical protein CPB83DRAFT_896137 [Crepidotus variabilis]|uniref:Uncharacterized protein n=1 Tax=Crepidotus variabilis TaxID=179855 RepID=A0A9P6JNA4_9AGAR|nr:hypothetical protein CPB83DRAFT_896137 [Crepidotus variabilis]
MRQAVQRSTPTLAECLLSDQSEGQTVALAVRESITPTTYSSVLMSETLKQPTAGNSTTLFGGAQNVYINKSTFNVVHAWDDDKQTTSGSQIQSRSNTSTHELTSSSTPASNILYQKSMLPKGRGYPLWFPQAGLNLPSEYRANGFSIGDVGYFTSDGGFEYLFNILLPTDHPFNGSASEVPEGFVPVGPINSRDIREHWDFEPGAYIGSPSVETSQEDSYAWNSGLIFRSSAPEGAILTMPLGARKLELSSTTAFRKYITQHAENWYKFVNGPRGRNLANGELRLIYGCDKSTAWGMATFSNACNPKLKFRKSQNMSGAASAYSWEHSSMAESVKVGPYLHDNEGLLDFGPTPLRNQCLFLRTMTVTLAEDVWEGLDIGRSVPRAPRRTGATDTTAVGGDNRIMTLLNSLSGTLNTLDGSGLNVVLHPSTIINNILLRLHPSAKMAITTDAVWQTVLTSNWMSQTIESLTYQLGLNEQPVLVEGVVCLDPLSTFSKSTHVESTQKEVLASKESVGNIVTEASLHVSERHADLGTPSHSRLPPTNIRSDISTTIQSREDSSNVIPDGDINMPSSLANLGQSLQRRFHQTGHLLDICNAIKHLEKAVLLTPEDDPNLPSYLAKLGSSLYSRFKLTGDVIDVSTAIRHEEKAVLLTAEDHPAMSQRLDNLGISFRDRFQQTGDLSDISNSIKHHEHSVLLTSASHVELPGRLTHLGWSLLDRFQQMGNLGDISAAIKYEEQAVLLTSEDHPGLLLHLDNLGLLLHSRFKKTADLSDVWNAINHKQKAVLRTPDDHPNLHVRLHSLGISFQSRFKLTGSIGDISLAIEHLERAVLLIPKGHPRTRQLLCDLGNSFAERYKSTHDEIDKSNAHKCRRRAKRHSS